ncbi:MAG TPA: hypothetical protein VHL57_02200, partial [Flavobacteriales bacterium]|nr:hypothetical protein [Flavobacteriales bacterium]
PIEILSGACMFLRKKTLDEVGLLDESFFMYGEDIDLSYRITLGGYENWYLPQARIIHYKGESTKKSSVNYVFVLYNAMAIFAKKHFTRRGTNFFSLLINGSIYLSAAAAIVMRFLRRMLLPMLDLLSVTAFTLFVFRHFIPSGDGLHALLALLVPGLAVLTCYGLAGAYDVPIRLLNVVKGAAFFGVLVALIRVFTADHIDDVPGLLAFGFVIAALVATAGILVRVLLHFAAIKPFSLRTLDRKRILSIGSVEENRHALALLWQTHFGLGRQERMDAADAARPDAADRIRQHVRRQGIDEVVFCAKDLKWGRIIELMEQLKRTGAMFKIAQPAREFIIGPSTIESLQDLLILEHHAVSSSAAHRRKRLLDLVVAIVLLLTLPLNIWWVRDKGGYVKNLFRVLTGRRSWVGYSSQLDKSLRLPRIRPGVLDPVHADALRPVPLTVYRVNLTYAKDYHVWQDLRLVWRGFAGLGS